MKKILLATITFVFLIIGTIVGYQINSIKLKNNASQQETIKKYIPKANTKTIMEFWKSHNNGFEFKESDFSYSKNPRFIGKSTNKNCKDLIIVQGKDEAFSISYSTPIIDENKLDTYSIDNMKNMLKIMSSSIDKLDNMKMWEEKIKERINNYQDKYETIDDNIISFYTDMYSNSLVLQIEKVNCHKYKNGEYKG